ncbi:MAG: L-histidine N(alpha)-methyltransferase, partial [Candidatus Methylomirabilales bacterium]
MAPPKRKPQIHVRHHAREKDPFANLAEDVRKGLTKTPKELQSKYFYDARGAELFEQITELPEYYQTRTERALLEQIAGGVVA